MSLQELSRAINPATAAQELMTRRECRRSLAAFTKIAYRLEPAAHHHLLIRELEAVARGENNRLMVFMPPGSAKSTYASILFPGWYLGNQRNKAIITASYAQRLSARFGRKCRSLIASEDFRRIFGFGLSDEVAARDEWETEAGGEYSATSVDGAVTGRRGDVILVDDPVKGRQEADSELVREATWEWWLSDLRTRLKPSGAIVLVMTRWHEDDLAGRILPADYAGETGDITARDGERWRVVSIKAEAEANDPLGRQPGEFLWPEWFQNGMLEHEKIAQGPRNWNALYQQRPSAESGDYFLKEWLHWYDTPPVRGTLKIYGASDYAVTADGGDYTVHLIAGVDPSDNIYILDLWRGQKSSDVWVEEFIELAQHWRPLQWSEEGGQIEKSVGPFLQKRLQETQTWIYRQQFTSAVDKAVRAQSIRGRMAMGKVYLPRNAPWVATLVAEMMAFPMGRNDDQVDTLSLLGRSLDVMIKGHLPPVPEPIRGAAEMTMNEAWKLGNSRVKADKRI